MNTRRSLSIVAVALIASVTVGGAGASAAPPTETDATAVSHWNQVAVATLSVIPGPDGGAPPAYQINMAMTQGAVYDAVNAIGPKRYQPYLLGQRFGTKASVEAAVATAAYEVLTSLVSTAPAIVPFPGRDGLLTALDDHYAAALDGVDDGSFERQGVAAGHAAAEAMLHAREGDGRFGPSQWVRNPAPGHWSPLLNAMGQEILDPTPWAGGVEPFLIESPSQFRSAPPPALDSAQYAAEVNEVKQIGRATGSTRTEHQTYVAQWWQWAPITAWNEVARALIDENDLSAADAARLLALQNLSGADASINCWNDKYHHDFWRPWNAIQRADEDGNADTIAEPGWTALITAPYPDLPSGHNCLDGAHVAVLRMVFGDVIAGGFQMTSASTFLPADAEKVRTFASFSQPLAELIEARIWAGLHYRFADVAGQLLGVNVAQYGAAHYFQPVGR
ncbi:MULTISPECIES: vanadium-dependent haloperoxidase [Microbacterium]|uniref:vanadium-dependent haloperoxidase n=1 Tax=Microbacterium TaxID=33882 RepID=UPI000D6598D7|nr:MULTISPECIES: vanadium-dependent haloperoxidase [Microbacterium]